MNGRVVSFLLCLVAVLAVLPGCGSGDSVTAPAGTDYTLDLEVLFSIAPEGAGAMSPKLEVRREVMIGSLFVEVSRDDAEELGVRLLALDARRSKPRDLDIRLGLRPGTNPSGLIFKTCVLGNPFGRSYVDLDLIASANGDAQFLEYPGTTLQGDGSIRLGQFRAIAEPGDRSRLPMVGTIPTIGCLFKGEPHRVDFENLIIILTPQILSDTHG